MTDLGFLSLGELRTREADLDRHWKLAWETLGPIRDERNAIRAEIARREETPTLPRPRYRTETQQRVSLCPRCSRPLSEVV